jgi:hypothetical protein
LRGNPVARAPEPVLQYAVPPPARRPGLLTAAEWLNYLCLPFLLAYLGLGAMLLAWGLDMAGGRVGFGNPHQVRVGGLMIAYGVPSTVAAVYCGLSIAARRRRKLTRGLSVLLSLFFPFGTLAGLFTFVVLGTAAARAFYEAATHDEARV